MAMSHKKRIITIIRRESYTKSILSNILLPKPIVKPIVPKFRCTLIYHIFTSNSSKGSLKKINVKQLYISYKIIPLSNRGGNDNSDYNV